MPRIRFIQFCLCLTFLTFHGAQTAQADDRSLVFLIGPTTEEHGRAAAHAAAGVAREWFQSPGSTVELRYTVNSDTQPFTSAMQIKDLESVFLYAADNDRKSDQKALLNGFDRAGFTLSHHSGKRLMIAILDAPSLSRDAEDRLGETLAFCKENSIAAIVLDLADPSSNPAALSTLATATGGALLHDVSALEATVRTLVPSEKPAAPSITTSAAASPAVRARFLRIQSSKARAIGAEFGPMHGYFITESPIGDLELQADGPNYLGRARVTEIVRNSEGKIVWQAKKEIVIKGPARKLEARKTGKLSYMRELQLPAGNYTLDATVEDLIAGKTMTASEPLTSGSSTPGFDVSDIVLVRSLDDSVDRFESDTAFAFDSRALVPLLDPLCRANQPIDLQIYMIIYPDPHGNRPDLNLEILQDGHAVAKSHLAFNEDVRNTATEGSGLDARGGRKNEFPYLARLPGVLLNAGNFEARITIRQNNRTLTRSTAFAVH